MAGRLNGYLCVRLVQLDPRFEVLRMQYTHSTRHHKIVLYKFDLNIAKYICELVCQTAINLLLSVRRLTILHGNPSGVSNMLKILIEVKQPVALKSQTEMVCK